MNNESLKLAMNLFDKYEKWDAFVELSTFKPEIRRRNLERLRSKINEYSISTETIKWHVLLNNEQYRWFLADSGQESMCIWWDLNTLKLWCNPNTLAVNEIKDLLTTPAFDPIVKCFDNIDSKSFPTQNHFFEEKHRYTFSNGLTYCSITIDRIDEESKDRLSWFAGNMTDEMARIIMDKVNRFRTPEITSLLMELNRIKK